VRASLDPPPPHAVDVRVAGSPLVALRFHLDSRISDLAADSADLERKLVEAVARRVNLELRGRRNDDVVHQALDVLPMLHALPAAVGRELATRLSEGVAVGAELATTQERIAGLKSRLLDIEGERAMLRETGERLAGLPAHTAVEVDLTASRYSQAARQIFQIVDEQHEAMARSILDGPMRRLTDAAFEAELAGQALGRQPVAAREAASRCREATVDAAKRLARQVSRLDPVDADHGIVPALRELLAGSADRGIVRMRVIGRERRLRVLSELTVYRIVDEALGNASRHSRATRVDLIVSFHPSRVIVVVKDDGDGFDVAATEARLGRSRAIGLIEMRERARLVGGRLEVRSIPGMGTEVRTSIPDPR
jgi:two-component system sensor histidine kinase DegS